MLWTAPQTILFSDLPNDGDTIAGPTLPAGCIFSNIAGELLTAWDNAIDTPSLLFTTPSPSDPTTSTHLDGISDPANQGPNPVLSGGRLTSSRDLKTPTSAPLPITITFSSANSLGPPTAGELITRIGYLTGPIT